MIQGRKPKPSKGGSRKRLEENGQLSLSIPKPAYARLHKWTQESIDEINATRNAVRGFMRPYTYVPMVGHDGAQIDIVNLHSRNRLR